ncbi:hypothetical protein [Fluviispira multicolorata]|uniref:Uncharacterized protein n=1 Tax=Fluviispira multicolorata TaxID=2654512 RepID=A0A833JCE7_9BACT|nr:hypothetical protein [Fluviispira multicolorata]KAB8030688.1 hypothetical protein GCL57_06855 [Fluviispira multicolorata]
MITTIENSKYLLCYKYKLVDINKYADEILNDYMNKFNMKNQFINGLGCGEMNLKKMESNLLVHRGLRFSERVALAGKSQYCPIISNCSTSEKEIKYYSDILLDPSSDDYEKNIDIMRIRHEEGVSKGLNISRQKIIKDEVNIINVFLSWEEKKVSEKNFLKNNLSDIKLFLDLSVCFFENKAKGVLGEK